MSPAAGWFPAELLSERIESKSVNVGLYQRLRSWLIASMYRFMDCYMDIALLMASQNSFISGAGCNPLLCIELLVWIPARGLKQGEGKRE